MLTLTHGHSSCPYAHTRRRSARQVAKRGARGYLLVTLIFMLTLPTTQAEELPPAAEGPEIPAKGYLVEEIKDGLYWVTDGVYQVMFLTTGQGVIAVDAPPNLGDKFPKAIAEVTDEPLTHLIYSHSHRDHIGAAGVFPGNITIIAHEETASQLQRSATPGLPLPTITFADRYVLTLGKQILELEYRGPHHEAGNIYIYAPLQRVLMLVDVIYPGWVPFKNLALAEDVPGYLQAHEEVLSFPFKTFIGGHVTRLGTRRDAKLAQNYVLDVRTHAAEALATTSVDEIAQRLQTRDVWLIFDTWMDAVAQKCAALTISDWRDRLGGTAVFTEDHCWVLAQSLRID